VLDVLLDAPGYMNTTDISTAADLPTVTARRALEDLTAHHVCERLSGGSGKADVWRISDTARQRYATATATFSETSGADAEKPPEPTVSETSGANEKTVTTPNTVMNDFSEKVPLKDVDTSPVTEDDVADLFGDVVAECRGCGGSVDSGQAYCFACDSR